MTDYAYTTVPGKVRPLLLGDAIREGYAELFAVYPDAHARSASELSHVFSTSSTGGKQVITKTVGTFKGLAEEAEFPTAAEQTDLHLGAEPLHTAVSGRPPEQVGRTPHTPSLHLDVQIHISPEASAEQIEQVFASMSKHLYGREAK